MVSADPSVHIYARTDLKKQITSDWFEPTYWQQKHQITGTSEGRFTTYFIDYQDINRKTKNMVLRHYYRGGLVRHMSRDKFVYTGIEQTRCYLELEMLAKMSALGLPVPTPVAARVKRLGHFFCTNDILIETIPSAEDGFHRLIKAPIADDVWVNIGQTIRRFHNENVHHSDLNIHNILIDNSNNIYLIDFDNCCFKEMHLKRCNENLERLLRSLRKEQGRHANFHFSEHNWQALLAGYGQ